MAHDDGRERVRHPRTTRESQSISRVATQIRSGIHARLFRRTLSDRDTRERERERERVSRDSSRTRLCVTSPTFSKKRSWDASCDDGSTSSDLGLRAAVLFSKIDIQETPQTLPCLVCCRPFVCRFKCSRYSHSHCGLRVECPLRGYDTIRSNAYSSDAST